MKKAIWAGVAVMALGVLVAQQSPREGFYVQGTKLYDANGKPFMFQGINYPQAWFGKYESYAAMKAKGANSVRIVLAGGCNTTQFSADNVKLSTDIAIKQRMVVVLENHDTTGYPDRPNSCSLKTAAEYWVSVKEALIGRERHVILNIGNEPWGNDADPIGWVAATKEAIGIVRAAGIKNLIMIDGPNWGQDHTNTMLEHAEEVFASDPLSNIIFSVHMYSVYEKPETVKAYIDAFAAKKLALVVGEFADQQEGKAVSYSTIVNYSKAKANGYMGWSWSGNSDKKIDMVLDFDPKRPTKWGKRFFKELKTSKEASIFKP